MNGNPRKLFWHSLSAQMGNNQEMKEAAPSLRERTRGGLEQL